MQYINGFQTVNIRVDDDGYLNIEQYDADLQCMICVRVPASVWPELSAACDAETAAYHEAVDG